MQAIKCPTMIHACDAAFGKLLHTTVLLYQRVRPNLIESINAQQKAGKTEGTDETQAGDSSLL
jgi:hypothetical protein